jgi:hypothetical protein
MHYALLLVANTAVQHRHIAKYNFPQRIYMNVGQHVCCNHNLAEKSRSIQLGWC